MNRIADEKFLMPVNGEYRLSITLNKLEVVAENKLKDEVYVTPAIAQESIIRRTANMLYRIGKN